MSKYIDSEQGRIIVGAYGVRTHRPSAKAAKIGPPRLNLYVYQNNCFETLNRPIWGSKGWKYTWKMRAEGPKSKNYKRFACGAEKLLKI